MKEKFLPLEVLTTALEGAKNGTLVVPKSYKNLTQEDGRLIESYGITKIEFEKGSDLKCVDVLAFFENQTLEEIDFSNCSSLAKISKKAFLRASKLKSVIFAENNNLKEVGERAFIGTNIKEIHFNNSALESIGDYAFFEAKKLEILDMSGCKNLKHVGTAITLGDLRFKLWDMSGCSKIQKFLSNGTHAEVLRVNANLKGNAEGNFYQTLYAGRVEVWDFGECKNKFLVLDSMGDGSIARLNVLKTGYLKDLERLGYKDISAKIINRFDSQNDLNIFVKNKGKFDEFCASI
ncbi:MAG: leucine-rich repeat protein, partial [Clostridia bacterium]|nr:leucine-rich repeat protein [Clostridia bacterium]